MTGGGGVTTTSARIGVIYSPDSLAEFERMGKGKGNEERGKKTKGGG